MRNRPCPCRSFCLCSRCRSICNRPCPCKSFGPYKRAFLSPCCQTDQTARRRACPTKDSTPESSRPCLRASPQAPHLPLKPSCSSSLSLLAPIRYLVGIPDHRVQQRESSLVDRGAVPKWIRRECHLETIRCAEFLSAFLRYDCRPPQRFHRDVNKMARSAWHQPIPDPTQPLGPEPYRLILGGSGAHRIFLRYIQSM